MRIVFRYILVDIFERDSIKRRWDKRIMCIHAGNLDKSTPLIGSHRPAHLLPQAKFSGPIRNYKYQITTKH